jgi:hypothetical protein
MKKLALILLLALLGLGLAPVIIALVGMGLAGALGCDPGGAGPCLHFGMDLGPMLQTMVMLHWLGLISLPLAALACLGLLLLGLIHLITRRRR